MISLIIHYKIVLEVNAFIPKSLGASANLNNPFLPNDFNWALDPGPKNLVSYPGQCYFGTDNRFFFFDTGTSLIYTVVTLDTTQIGQATQLPYRTYSDPTHQAIFAQNPGTTLDYWPNSYEVTTATDNGSDSVKLPSPTSTQIDIEADGTHPFSPWFAPGIHIEGTWGVSIGAGITTNVVFVGKTTEFPAFEVLANGKVIKSYVPVDPGPSVFNLGPQGFDHFLFGFDFLP